MNSASNAARETQRPKTTPAQVLPSIGGTTLRDAETEILWVESADLVYGIVSSHDVTLLSKPIPTDSVTKVRAAAPYAIEDDIAQDPSHVHVAVGERSASGQWLVAVVDQALMRSWSEEFRISGHTPEALIPECCAIPVQDAEAICIDRGDHFVVSLGRSGGFCIEAYLFRDIAAEVLSDMDVTRVVIHSDRPLAYLPRSASQGLQLEYASALSDEDYNALLSSGVESAAVNLLQGPYGTAKSWPERMGQWRVPGLALAVLFLSYVALTIGEGVRMNAEAEGLQEQIVEVAREALPDVTRIVNPRTQIQARLRSLGGTGENQFLSLSAVLFDGLTDIGTVRLESMQYASTSDQLTATVSLSDYAEMERLRTAIVGRGFAFAEGGSRTTDGLIISEVTVSAP